jgi:hypothetical protein
LPLCAWHPHPHPEIRNPQSAIPRDARLLLAFTSHRARPAFVTVYFYEHDGVGQGRIVGSIPPTDNAADYHPALGAGGAVCAHTQKKGGGFAGLVKLWDVRAKKHLEDPALNDGFGVRIEPALSADGGLLAFSAWARQEGAGGWDVFLYDARARKLLDLPNLNTRDDEREVALSGDGRYLAFLSHRAGGPSPSPLTLSPGGCGVGVWGTGVSDIFLYDRAAKGLVSLPGLNTPARELSPALSGDGRLLAFVSDRPGGRGGKDVYLYDRQKRALVPLPGLNSVAHEQTPALSPDGRYLAFVSERSSGAGERDVYLYDRQTSRLLPTPGLNSKQEDFDPSLIYVNPAATAGGDGTAREEADK